MCSNCARKLLIKEYSSSLHPAGIRNCEGARTERAPLNISNQHLHRAGTSGPIVTSTCTKQAPLDMNLELSFNLLATNPALIEHLLGLLLLIQHLLGLLSPAANAVLQRKP